MTPPPSVKKNFLKRPRKSGFRCDFFFLPELKTGCNPFIFIFKMILISYLFRQDLFLNDTSFKLTPIVFSNYLHQISSSTPYVI